ncbi:unnamed protein product, partial [Clonostachys chloroleuca]
MADANRLEVWHDDGSCLNICYFTGEYDSCSGIHFKRSPDQSFQQQHRTCSHWRLRSYQVACNRTHILINIVSTLLLGASNYYMQTISAPMRQDVDNAHARGKWLDIGIPSVRNVLYIEKRRLVVWLCLGLSSLPLHFIYNSTFIVSTANQLCQILLVDKSFISGGPFDKDSKERLPVFEIHGHEYYIPFELELGQSLQFIQEAVQNNEYEKLTPDDWIKGYAKGLVYGRANVVMVLNPPEDCHEFKNLPMFYEASGPVYYKPPMNSSIYASLRYETTLNANRGDNDWFSWICSLTLYEADRLRLPKCSDGAWKNQMSPVIWTLDRQSQVLLEPET